MEDNSRKEGGEEAGDKKGTHSTVSVRTKKNEMNRVQSPANDSDTCECHCKSSLIREGPRRKSWSGSKYAKGKSKKTPTIPCSSSEACEYDKEHGEDEEDEGEGTQTEHPELSSLLHGLCNSKYGNNSRENNLRYSNSQKNRRDSKNQKSNRKSGDTPMNQDNSGPTSQVQGTSQTCDFMSGLHYAIPFLSDRLRSSLLNRLRCQSEPRNIGTNGVPEGVTQTRDIRNDPSDSDSSSERYDLPEIPRPLTQQLPPRGHDNHSKQIPLPCQPANQGRASSSLPTVKNVQCHHKESESMGISQTAAQNCKSAEDQDVRKDFNDYNGSTHYTVNGCSVEHDEIKISSKIDHDLGHEESCSHVKDNHDEPSHDDDDTLHQCVEGNVCSSEDDDIEAAVNRLAEDVGTFSFLEHLNLDGENQDNHGDRGDHDVWYCVEGGAGLDVGLAAGSDDDSDLEAAVNCLAENVEKFDFLEHVHDVLIKEDDEISSDDSSETVPDLFSSLSSDSCQADDEFECDCGHCSGSGQGHHNNGLDLDWQTAGRLESSGREDNSSPDRLVIPVGSTVISDPEDDAIEEGVYQISLLPPLDSHQLEAMFETMIAQLQEINLGGGEEQAPPPASTSTIDSLPSIPVTDQQIDDLAPCSICLSSFVVMDTSSHLPCSHLFHLHCIKAWLAKSATCPVCRRHLESPGNS